MPLIPYRSFCLETRLTPDEVVARLAAAVEPVQWFRLWRLGSHCPFQGEVRADGFRIMRIISYNNSFLPVIRGHVNPTTSGAQVEGTMALHPAVAVFMTLWLGGVSIFCVVTFAVVVMRGVWNPMFLIPFVMFLFGCGVTASAFSFEAWLSLRKLREIVAAEPDKPTVASEPRE